MEWLFVDEVSKRYSLTERAIREKAYKGDFGDLDKGHRLSKGKGRGGKQIQIALESLPKAAQARYHGEKQPHEDILQYTGKQRIEADFRALVVLEYQHSRLSPNEYVAKFNGENPPEDAITTSKLFRWQKQYREGGIAGLIDQRGGHNRGQTSILISEIRTLRKMPERYPVIDDPNITARPYRVLYVPKWTLVLYHIVNDEVWIDYIVDARQNYSWIIK